MENFDEILENTSNEPLEETPKTYTMQIDRKAFNNGIMMASNAVARKTTNPVLSGIKIHVKENILNIYATDLQTGFHKKINLNSKTDDEYAYVADQKTLSEMLQSLSEDILDITYDGTLRINASHTNFRLPTMDAEEYPNVIPSVIGTSITLEKNTILRMIEKVIFCALKDSDQISRNLNGVYWDFREGGYLTLVASDSYRLALSEVNVGQTDMSSFLLSLKSMEELKIVLQNAKSSKIDVHYDGSRVLFDFLEDDLKLVLNVVDAKFPNYPQIIPNAFKIKMKIKTQEFLWMLKRISIASGASKQMKMSIKEEDIIITSNSPDVGEAKEFLTAKKDGEDISIAYAHTYLKEAVDKIETSEFEFNISGESNPSVIKPVEDNSYMYIVMPTRVKND
jgi:DNA polymerase-3 subunit beta